MTKFCVPWMEVSPEERCPNVRKLQQQLKKLNVNFLRLYFNLFKFNKGNKDKIKL